MTTETTTNRESQTSVSNPFRQSYHARLAGQYKPPSVADRCERQLHEQEPGVAMARDVRLDQVPEVAAW